MYLFQLVYFTYIFSTLTHEITILTEVTYISVDKGYTLNVQTFLLKLLFKPYFLRLSHKVLHIAN